MITRRDSLSPQNYLKSPKSEAHFPRVRLKKFHFQIMGFCQWRYKFYLQKHSRWKMNISPTNFDKCFQMTWIVPHGLKKFIWSENVHDRKKCSCLKKNIPGWIVGTLLLLASKTLQHNKNTFWIGHHTFQLNEAWLWLWPTLTIKPPSKNFVKNCKLEKVHFLNYFRWQLANILTIRGPE